MLVPSQRQYYTFAGRSTTLDKMFQIRNESASAAGAKEQVWNLLCIRGIIVPSNRKSMENQRKRASMERGCRGGLVAAYAGADPVDVRPPGVPGFPAGSEYGALRAPRSLADLRRRASRTRRCARATRRRSRSGCASTWSSRRPTWICICHHFRPIGGRFWRPGSRLAPYRNLMPASAGEPERRLYLADLEALLEIAQARARRLRP